MSKINKEKNRFGAYLIVKSGYNESTRNLDFRVKCENYEEFRECIKEISQYNNFEAENILDYFDTQLDSEQKKYLRFHVGREGSPVIYISSLFSSYLDDADRFLKNGEEELAYDEYSYENGGYGKEIRIWWD